MLFFGQRPKLKYSSRSSYIYFIMYLTTLLSLMVLAAGLNCPLADQYRSTALSGSLAAEPDLNTQAQDMKYTNSFGTALAQVPQVCLSISGYEDQNKGFMKINIKTEQVSQQSFIVRVTSPAICKWTKLDIHYLASTKREIEIGIVAVERPTYDTNGYITLPYVPATLVNKDTKIRQFLVGIDIQAQGNSALSISYINALIGVNYINFLFASPNCNIYSLTISVVIFDPSTPGILFVDGSIEQNSLSTSTEVKIQRTYIEELRIYFVGFNSLNAKDVTGIKLSVSFSNTFSLLIDSTLMRSIKVNYLVISFVDCGSCSGYPLLYSDVCYASCPKGTELSQGTCVPVDCRNGYQYNANRDCVPVCGPNKYFSGKSCTCVQGYNMINGECSQCPSGTYYNYMAMRCDSICGDNSRYNETDRRCYCFNGYVIINGQCSTCTAGTQYDPITQVCLNRPIDCGLNEVIAYGKCMCANTYFKINGVCQRCPAYSTYTLGYCQCDSGYTMNGNTCIPNCRDTETLVNGQCQCRYGLVRDVFGNCVPLTCGEGEYANNGQCTCINGYSRNQYNICVPIVITCPQFEILVNRACNCIPGYTRNNRDGRCYQIQCQPGFSLDAAGNCVPRCAYGTNWDQGSQRCIPQCTGGFVYDFNFASCIPVCQNNYRWNGTQCACYQNCPIVCPPGTYLDNSGRCASYQCPGNQVWVAGSCTCPPGTVNYNGNCQPPCRDNSDYINGRCECRRGFYDNNGICSSTSCPPGQRWDDPTRQCIPICNPDKIWNQGNCICPQGTWDINGLCTACQYNERYFNGRCECVNGLYRINGVCTSCGANQVFVNGRCDCAQGLYRINGGCVGCGVNQVFVNGRCECVQGLYRINGACAACPPGSAWNPVMNTCVPIIVPSNCVNGKVWDGYRCICPAGTVETQYGSCSSRCSDDKIQLPNGQCVCRDGQTMNQYGLCASLCPSGQAYVNGNCVTSCGKGEQWSGYNCVCMPNYERVAPNFCAPSCGRYQRRIGHNCECQQGYQRRGSNECIPIGNTCPAPHRLLNGVCVCAAGYERNQQGTCTQVCQPGYARNGLGFCVVSCTNEQLLVDGRCVCRVGLYNVNGLCKKCPEFSYESNGRCFCTGNNYPLAPGATCSTPACPSNTDWNPSTQSCACRPPMVWSYGQCQIPRNCGPNEVWSGNDCVCIYGYQRVGNVCQYVDQTYYCPENSIFNGVNCQCIQGFYPYNNQACQRCPTNNYWNGQQCGSSTGSCTSGFQWDSKKFTCNYQHRCGDNQEWDGANCVCSQGYFWIDSRCQECPPGTVFDGRQCSRGQPDSKCRGAYSYFNGFSCVCIPGYWPLSDGCVTCPSGYEWSGVCCLPRAGLMRSVSQTSYGNTVPARRK